VLSLFLQISKGERGRKGYSEMNAAQIKPFEENNDELVEKDEFEGE
jgi:hypothetical protein